jgi:hypothetical protein
MDGLWSVQDLFSVRAFRIPEYQRGYSWEREQWDDLLDDLDVLPRDNGQFKDHFTGTVVLQPTTIPPITDVEGTSYPVFEVVDGQQRLTTLVLLLEAIRRRADGQLAGGIERRYIRVTDRAGQPQTKLRFSDGSQAYFEENVLEVAPGPGEPATRAQARLSDAVAYFDSYLGAREADLGDGFRPWLFELHGKIGRNLKINLYEVEGADEVGVIFEVMNNRGRPLSELDLVKNYILYLGTKLNVEHALHDDVASAWSRILGGLMSADLGNSWQEDQLLRAHWLMGYDHTKKNWDGSKSVKQWFNLREYDGNDAELLTDLREYVRSLKNASIAYADIQKPTRPGAFAGFEVDNATRLRLIRSSDRLRRLGAMAVFLPLLIAVRLRFPRDAEAYVRAVDLAERYAFRVYRLLGKRADAGESTIARIANQLYGEEIGLDEGLSEFRAALFYYCSDQQFRAAFEMADDHNDWYSWGAMRYLLYEYEQHLCGGDNVKMDWQEVERLSRERTIEHVLPQTPTDTYWTDRFDEEAIRLLTHDIGNLALTADNRSYSNKPFPVKRGVPGQVTPPCYANANLRNERELATWEEWTPESVLERRTRIVDWILDRWHVEAGANERTADVPTDEVVQDTDEPDGGA